MNCNGQQKSAVSHNNSALKSDIIIPWKAPEITSGPLKIVEFKFTVVKDHGTYWVKEMGTSTVAITYATETGTTEGKILPKVLCKLHYGNFHLEMEVCKLGVPIRGLYRTFFEILFFKFPFSHKRFQMGKKKYFYQFCKLQ